MSGSSTEHTQPPNGVSGATGRPTANVMTEQATGYDRDDEISVRELWDTLWRGKWLVISVTALFAVGSVLYALLATEWYRAEVTLAPAKERTTPSLAGQLGGLAALAGVSVGGTDSSEAIATLRSREFARAFIDELSLLPLFFADEWSVDHQRWLGDDPVKQPDIRDGVKFFHDNVLKVDQDRQTGLVTLAVEWTDAETSAAWANELASRLNRDLRGRALREAEANVLYLQAELAHTSVLSLQQTISRLLETEMQKLMLARGNEEFAFRVIDRAENPKYRVRPKRTLTVILSTLVGGMFSVLAVFFVNAFRVPVSRRDGYVLGRTD